MTFYIVTNSKATHTSASKPNSICTQICVFLCWTLHTSCDILLKHWGLVRQRTEPLLFQELVYSAPSHYLNNVDALDPQSKCQWIPHKIHLRICMSNFLCKMSDILPGTLCINIPCRTLNLLPDLQCILHKSPVSSLQFAMLYADQD